MANGVDHVWLVDEVDALGRRRDRIRARLEEAGVGCILSRDCREKSEVVDDKVIGVIGHSPNLECQWLTKGNVRVVHYRATVVELPRDVVPGTHIAFPRAIDRDGTGAPDHREIEAILRWFGGGPMPQFNPPVGHALKTFSALDVVCQGYLAHDAGLISDLSPVRLSPATRQKLSRTVREYLGKGVVDKRQILQWFELVIKTTRPTLDPGGPIRGQFWRNLTATVNRRVASLEGLQRELFLNRLQQLEGRGSMNSSTGNVSDAMLPTVPGLRALWSHNFATSGSDLNVADCKETHADAGFSDYGTLHNIILRGHRGFQALSLVFISEFHEALMQERSWLNHTVLDNTLSVLFSSERLVAVESVLRRTAAPDMYPDTRDRLGKQARIWELIRTNAESIVEGFHLHREGLELLETILSKELVDWLRPISIACDRAFLGLDMWSEAVEGAILAYQEGLKSVSIGRMRADELGRLHRNIVEAYSGRGFFNFVGAS